MYVRFSPNFLSAFDFLPSFRAIGPVFHKSTLKRVHLNRRTIHHLQTRHALDQLVIQTTFQDQVHRASTMRTSKYLTSAPTPPVHQPPVRHLAVPEGLLTAPRRPHQVRQINLPLSFKTAAQLCFSLTQRSQITTVNLELRASSRWEVGQSE